MHIVDPLGQVAQFLNSIGLRAFLDAIRPLVFP
ncbi:hypothetical protein MP11Mi_16110 [Gordonia sp. MP11Mi]|uniref:Uncharacterized protein n=1 Tax=Gordonia sp. MP11Mi TaxID=3022769 RepID=A0AA97GWB4_9ACTN